VWGVGWACAGKAKRQAAMALLGCLEKLCSSNDPISAEQWARALRSRLLAGSDLEILDVDVLNNLAILYYSRMQYRRSLKAIKAAIKTCTRLEGSGIMTSQSAATRKAALHLNSCDTLARLKRHNDALHSANSALSLLEHSSSPAIEDVPAIELRCARRFHRVRSPF
jgi:tetratricopeptide (TPR) repeat protein